MRLSVVGPGLRFRCNAQVIGLRCGRRGRGRSRCRRRSRSRRGRRYDFLLYRRRFRCGRRRGRRGWCRGRSRCRRRFRGRGCQILDRNGTACSCCKRIAVCYGNRLAVLAELDAAVFVEHDDLCVGQVDAGAETGCAAAVDNNACQTVTRHQAFGSPAVRIIPDVQLGCRYRFAVGFHFGRNGCNNDLTRCYAQLAVHRRDPADKIFVHEPIRIGECQGFQICNLRIINKAERCYGVIHLALAGCRNAAVDFHGQRPYAAAVGKRKGDIAGAVAAVLEQLAVIGPFFCVGGYGECGDGIIIDRDVGLNFGYFRLPLQ